MNEILLPAPKSGTALHMASEKAVVLHEDDWKALQAFVSVHLHKADASMTGLDSLAVSKLKVAEVAWSEA